MAEPSSKPGRQRMSRAPAALSTIHETPRNTHGCGILSADKKLGLGVGEKVEINNRAPCPVKPPPTYHGGVRPNNNDGAPRYSQINNQIPPNARQSVDTYHLPYFHNPGRRPPLKKSLYERISLFFHRITEDKELAPLPTSRRPSEQVDDGLHADERGQSIRQAGAPTFGDGMQTAPENNTENIMFLQAMEINGDVEVEHALAVDADVQLYPQPQPHNPTEVSNFSENHLRRRNQERGEGEKPRQGQEGKERPRSSRISLQMLWRKRLKRKIVHNCDTILNQQLFILILAKALLAFGSPSHRIEPQLASVANMFELPAQFAHMPGCVQVAFGLPEQRASEVLLIKASVALDLGRIQETHAVYRAVVRDEISASDGRSKLKKILDRPPLYPMKLLAALTFFQGSLLCGVSFKGSLNDMWVSGILSIFVYIAQQKAAKSELSASGADIFISATVSLIARALSLKIPGRIFCYQSISSASITSLLPGTVMLQGVLDIASKNIYLGSSKLIAGLMTSLYLGFGLTLGSDVWLHFDKVGRNVLASTSDKLETFNGTFFSTNASTPEWLSPSNLTGVWEFQELSSTADSLLNGCHRDPNWPWPLRRLPIWTLFFTTPILSLVFSIKRMRPIKSREMPVMVLISCCSYAVIQLANLKMGLTGYPDYTALLGSFVVSLLGNLYSRHFKGTAFTVMLTGIWLLIPNGLADAGGLSGSYADPDEDEYTQSLNLARKMISVMIGIMSGVYLSARVIYTSGRKKNSAFVTF